MNAEVKELKEIISRLQEECTQKMNCWVKAMEENKELKEKKDFLVKHLEKRLNQVKVYSQALEEIRDLLNQIDDSNWLHTDKHIYMDDKCIQEIKSRIATKINEVLK